MSSTIISLALLKVNWDHLKKDYLENFLPFIATLCVNRQYRTIDINTLCSDFTTEYGLIVPYHPMFSILNRARKRGILKKHFHNLYPVEDKVLELDFTDSSREQANQHRKVIEQFIAYADQNYSISMSEDEAEKAFLTMLQRRDLDILFAAEEGKLFPEVESKKGHQYLTNKFIQYAYGFDSEMFSFIMNMAVGHVLASAILYADFTKFEGALNNINFYFDTRFILRVLGAEGSERQQHYTEFLGHLLDEGAILRVFRHTCDEVMAILNTCLRWVENSAYDPARSSSTCNYFVQNNYKESDVERFMVNVEPALKGLRIEIVDAPDAADYKAYQIDEDALNTTIVDIYSARYWYFDELGAKETLLRDIKSISSIYRLRLGRRPHSLSKVGSMFVTTNGSLAHASSNFQRAQGGGGFIYPACITDVFLGTLVWLQSPARVASINRKKMIADCYAAVQPSKVLMKKYRLEVEKLRSEGKISEDEFYMLRSHRIAMNLLEEKTLGDPDNFTDRTPEEILELIKQEHQAEPTKKYLEICDKLREMERDFERSKDEVDALTNRISDRAARLARVVGRIVFSVLVLLLVAGVLCQSLAATDSLPFPVKLMLLVVTVALGVINVVTGFNIKGFRDSTQEWVTKKFVSYFRA